MSAKRDDYFEAGTIAVWDVDSRAETVTLFVKDQPPQVFRSGELAHAEPAELGWMMKVDDIFG